MQGGDEALVAGEPLADERLEARSRSRSRCSPRVGTPRSAAFRRQEALEVIAQVAYTTLANYAADVSGTPVDAAFS